MIGWILYAAVLYRLANCYFAHYSLGFPSCYGSAMRNLRVLLIHRHNIA